MRFLNFFYILSGLSLFLFQPSVFAVPDIQHWVTENGARVYFVHAKDLPMIDLQVAFDAGSARDANKPGLATLVNGLLNEGASGLSAEQLAEQFAQVGAIYSTGVDQDESTVALRSLSSTAAWQQALNTFITVLTHPDFPKKSVERVRQQMLSGLKSGEQSPDTTADRRFYELMFASHPYSTPTEGTVSGVNSITIEEIKTFYQRYYVAKNAIVAIMGDVDRAGAEKIASSITGQLPVGEVAAALPPVLEEGKVLEAKTVHLDFPSTQTHLLIGQLGTFRNDPDYFTLYVGNYILGGSGLVSRLSDEVREKRGLAYSAYSYFYPLRRPGPFTAGLQTRTEKAEEALQLVKTVLQQFIEQGPTQAELDSAKKGITGMFPLKIKSNRDIIGYLATIGFYELPLDYLNTFNEKIEAVTLDMIKETFKRRLSLDKWVIVTVGKGKFSQ